MELIYKIFNTLFIEFYNTIGIIELKLIKKS